MALTWLVTTLAATALHWWVWIASPGADGTPSLVEGSWPKEVSGLLMMAALPGWGVVSKVLGFAAAQSVFLAGAAYGSGFGLLAVGGTFVLWCRAEMLMRPPKSIAPISLSRRRLLTDAPIALAGLGGSAALGVSVLAEPWDLMRPSHRVPIQGLPAHFEGLRIIQLSDTHFGPRIPGWHVERAVQMALDARPDLILLTGDYIHNGARYISHAAAMFRPLTASGIPCAAVLGNHDWYGGGPAVRAALRSVGIRTVDNANVYLGPGRRLMESPRPDSLCVAGVGDLLEDSVDFEAALAGVPAEMPRILLSHNPDVAEMIGPSRRVDLMLCGHTHGGQVRVPLLGTPWVPSRYGSKYAGGLVQGPNCRVIISRGVGTSIMPVRLGVPPEVVEIVLTSA